MAVIQIEKGLGIKTFYNWLDCPRRGNCPGQEEREKRLKEKFPSTEGRCFFNPGIYECEFHPEFNHKAGVPKHYDLNCL